MACSRFCTRADRYDYAEYRPFRDTNFWRLYKTSERYTQLPGPKRMEMLRSSLADAGLNARYNPRGSRNAEEESVYIYSAQTLFVELARALIMDDPDVLPGYMVEIRALNTYIVDHPAKPSTTPEAEKAFWRTQQEPGIPGLAIRLYHGTKLQTRQFAAIHHCGALASQRVFRIPKYMSLSTDQEAALMFAGPDAPIMEFVVAAGCSNCARLPDTLVWNPDEKEWVMPPYTPVRLMSDMSRSVGDDWRQRRVLTFEVLDGKGVSMMERCEGWIVPTCLVMVQEGGREVGALAAAARIPYAFPSPGQAAPMPAELQALEGFTSQSSYGGRQDLDASEHHAELNDSSLVAGVVRDPPPAFDFLFLPPLPVDLPLHAPLPLPLPFDAGLLGRQ